MLFCLERWHSFVNLALRFLVCSWVFGLSGRDWWVKCILGWWYMVRKEWYSKISVRSTWWWGALCVFCVGFWTLLQVTGSTECEGRSTLRIYCFCFHIYYLWSTLFGKCCFSLVRPGRDFRLSLETYQTPILYTKWLFYWLIEFRAEEVTGSSHPFVCTSHDGICHSTSAGWNWRSTEKKLRLSGIYVFEEGAWI